MVGSAGFTFCRGDQSDPERMLDLLIHNPELRRQSAARERERIQEQYLWPEIARAIEKTYFDVLGWTASQKNASQPPQREFTQIHTPPVATALLEHLPSAPSASQVAGR